MKPSKLLPISVFITAVILVMVGVVTTSIYLNNRANEIQEKYDQLQQEAIDTQVKYDQLVNQFNQREQQYQQLIQEANQKLEKANTDLLAMQQQLQQLSQQQPAQQLQNGSTLASTDPSGPTNTSITADAAGQIAQKVADLGQLLLKQPELVSFQGKAAYEAAFDKGSIYVDAQDGSILLNGTVPQQITLNQAVQLVESFMNYKDIYQSDLIHIGTTALYRVILKNGYIAYVDLTGQITNINPPTISNVDLQTSSGGSGGSSSGHSSHHSSSHSENNDN